MSDYNELVNIDIAGKNILVREDLNVPIENGKIINDARIRAIIPTIEFALSKGSKLAIISHFGRPTEGKFNKKFSLQVVAKRLSEIFKEIDERLKNKNLDRLHIDYGYALESIKQNRKSLEPLKRIEYKDMRKKMFPQISIMIDPKGDVYGYHEATFLDKDGSERYCIGRVSKETSLEKVIREFIKKPEGVESLPLDISYLDAYDHIITILLNQADSDKKFGIPWSEGPIKARIY